MRILMKKILLITFLLSSLCAWADIRVPEMTGPIVDETKSLSPDVIKELSDKIFSVYKNKEGPQVQVLVVSTLEGHVVEDVAEKVFRVWALGDKKRDDGVLFLVAIKDRKMRIEVGYGLEGELTDYDSKQITTRVKKYFKQEDYASGIREGVNGILEIVSRPHAVQTPVASAPAKPKVAPRVKSAAEVESERAMFFVILLGLVGSFGGFFILRTLSVAYMEKKKLFEASVLRKQEAKSELEYLQKRYQIKDLKGMQDHIDMLNKKAVAFAKESYSMLGQIREETAKKRTSPQAKYDDIMQEVYLGQNQVKTLESEIRQYQQIIREGR